MKHSKGNWKIGGKYMNVVITDNGEDFPKDTGHNDVAYYGGHLIAESICKKADAQLISAAPDLLEALHVVYDANIDAPQIPEIVMIKIKKAIDKAEGL